MINEKKTEIPPTIQRNVYEKLRGDKYVRFLSFSAKHYIQNCYMKMNKIM